MDIWSEESKYREWLRVELALLASRVGRKGGITTDCYNFIARHATFTIERIHELEAINRHDLLSFVQCVQENVIAAGIATGRTRKQMERWAGQIHKGITSYDTEDPALMLTLRTTCRLILKSLVALRTSLIEKAKEHKGTRMIARTHGKPAEPDTFARLLLTFVSDLDECILHLRWIERNMLSQAKFSGAVGNYGGMDPKESKDVLARLKLREVGVATQIVQRGRHATYVCALAVTAGYIERIARVLWEMTRFEVGEVEEAKGPNQKGSSAMPHKKNPIILEQLQGVAVLLRGYAGMALETISTPDCRAIEQSIVERHVFPDATYVVYYALGKAKEVIDNLIVFPDRMRHNLHTTACDLWAGQSLKVALLNKGIDPEVAYKYVQEVGFAAWDEHVSVRTLLDRPIAPELPSANKLLGKANVQRIFDPQLYLTRQGGLQEIYRRYGI